MALDEELLARNARGGENEDSSPEQESSQDRVGKFNAGRAAAAKAASSASTSGLAKAVPGPAGLATRAALMMAKKNQPKSADQSSTGNGNPATSNLLKAAWQNIIPTFGLSVIWIDIHIILSQVLGKDLFCSLGSEWLPKGTPRNLDGAKRSLGLTEGMGVGCLNIGCLVIFLSVLVVIAMIVTGINNPLEVIKNIFATLWCAIGNCEK